MNEQEKRESQERYKEKKEKGILFFPDLIFKDAVVALFIFIGLVALAYFIGAPLEERANPADAFYTPKPEWYFLFLFQLLKYFPGSLEVIGVIVLPTIAFLLLVALPFLDRSPKRHYRSRLIWVGITAVLAIGIIGLTVQAFLEAPPPVEVAQGDQTAALYVENCAPCHGASIRVASGTDLHNLIAEGKHEGMPAWSADLTSDEIDSLAGFVLSPGGSQLFVTYCGACHTAPALVAEEPLELKRALEEGPAFDAHADQDLAHLDEVTSEERTTLLNFLVVPDGQRLFATNCAPCHGRSVSYSGDEADLEDLIRDGGAHLEMPSWRETLSGTDLDSLARYVVQPTADDDGAALFEQFCTDCHGSRIPGAADIDDAREIIASGGAHETMPVWGDILTDEQVAALVAYTQSAASGVSSEVGQRLYAQNCASCHGDFGEGGANPARSGDIIAPISTAEYLKTRDDLTLRSVIAQGQPNFGMAPFGNAFGGPLDDSEIETIVAFMRSWEENPPVELPPEVVPSSVALSGEEIFIGLCAQCHGERGEGLVGPSLSDPLFQYKYSDTEIFDSISTGHSATAMIAWGEILTSDQIAQIVTYLRQLGSGDATTTSGAPSFSSAVLPIFVAKCTMCHGSMGGWDGTSYQVTMNTGDNAPVVIPGDVEGSLLAQKLIGTHETGTIMPPGGQLPDSELQLILDWIASGALDN
jgi:mono/diheme cytochrome c family protein